VTRHLHVCHTVAVRGQVTARQEERAKRSSDEEELHKHIFQLWWDDLLVNLWPPERFAVGRQVRARAGSVRVCACARAHVRIGCAGVNQRGPFCPAGRCCAQVCRSLSKELMRMLDIRIDLGHRTDQIESPALVLSKLEGTVAIIAPSNEPPAQIAHARKGAPFGPAVLDILERSARPSNGRLIFSTLTELDLHGTAQSSIDDYGAIRLLPVPARSPLCAHLSPLRSVTTAIRQVEQGVARLPVPDIAAAAGQQHLGYWRGCSDGTIATPDGAKAIRPVAQLHCI
jgi:hypothetical protein